MGHGTASCSGADSRKFLQGQCTNDINLLKKHGDSIAAAFLTTKGRIFTDALLYYHQPDSATDGDILIESQSKLITELHKYLNMFKLRSKVKMEVMDYDVVFSSDVTSSDALQQHLTQPSNNTKPLLATVDPRLEGYGSRFILPSGTGKSH